VSAPDEHEDATLLMIAAAEGDQSAAARLLPLVYQQLRAAAQLQMAGERAGSRTLWRSVTSTASMAPTSP